MFYQSKNTRRAPQFTVALLGAIALATAIYFLPNLASFKAEAQSANPPGASVSVPISVPASMRSSPFDVARNLNVPPDFSIAVYARIPAARFMAITPNGDLLVSQPNFGKVSLVRPNANGDPIISDFVTGLRRPHDIVFHEIDGTMYVYIAETHQIDRYTYASGDLTPQNRQLVVTGLPDDEINGELGGAHNHALKNIAIDSQHNLYVSNASATNANPSDLAANPKRAAIYVYDAQIQQTAQEGRLFAQGIRNAEGLAFLPGTDQLWVVINNRDNIRYPFRNDFDGDGSDDFGKAMPSYVDNHPPEEFTKVRDGGNYGWPYANPNPDTANGLNNMPFDFDYDNNRDWSVFPETTFDRITKGIQAHSAPLGFSFLQGTNFPAAYRNGAVIAYHGSWNRTQRTGYKVAYFPWNSATNTPGDQINLVTGFINSDQSIWGRPVDAIPDPQGNLFISDDYSGTIYKLRYTGQTTAPNGLKGEYFTNKTLAGSPALTRTDATVNFDWANASPASQIPADSFSARWSGQVEATTSGNYTFSTVSDDGVRLYVNNQLVINNWTDHSPTTDTSGSIALTAGQKYNITMEYYENGGQATAKLLWKTPGSSASVVIPKAQFYPVSGTSLPSSWQTSDVGSVGLSGAAIYNNGAFTLRGGGADIWGTSDAFRFVYQTVSGARGYTLTARVVSQTNTDNWAKAGVMIRQSLDANSAHAMTVQTPFSGTAFQRRLSAGAESTHTAGANLQNPVWVRIRYTSGAATGFISTDGANWTQIGAAQTLSLTQPFQIGLVVTSHNNLVLSEAVFDNVSIETCELLCP